MDSRVAVETAALRHRDTTIKAAVAVAKATASGRVSVTKLNQVVRELHDIGMDPSPDSLVATVQRASPELPRPELVAALRSLEHQGTKAEQLSRASFIVSILGLAGSLGEQLRRQGLSQADVERIADEVSRRHEDAGLSQADVRSIASEVVRALRDAHSKPPDSELPTHVHGRKR